MHQSEGHRGSYKQRCEEKFPLNNAEILAYLRSLATQRRLSPLTVASYRHDLSKLEQYAQEICHGDIAWAVLTPVHIRRLAAKVHAKGMSGRSIARMLSAWRGFYHWLNSQGYTTLNPVDGLRAPKSARPLPNALPVDETTQLLDSIRRPAALDERLWYRDIAMMELFYSSGLRLAELADLNIPEHDGCLDLATGEVNVLGKGSRQRVVPVGRQAQQALRTWLSVRDQLAPATEMALFVGRNGQRLGHRAIRERLVQAGQQAGLPTRLHPHRLRHAFASHVLQSSGDLRAVQEMLGHASIVATQVYTHLDFQALAKVYDAAHPRAQRQSVEDADDINTD